MKSDADKSRIKRLGKENRDGGRGQGWSLMQKGTKEREWKLVGKMVSREDFFIL